MWYNKTKKPRSKRSCLDGSPSSISQASRLDRLSCMPFDSLSARNELIIRHLPQIWSTRQKREQRQKIAKVQFASLLPKGMFEITVSLEWEWKLIKVQTSQAAVTLEVCATYPEWLLMLLRWTTSLAHFLVPESQQLSSKGSEVKMMVVIVEIYRSMHNGTKTNKRPWKQHSYQQRCKFKCYVNGFSKKIF